MIKDNWRRCAGIHVTDKGTLAAVWIAHDRDADTVHAYDCAIFKREVLAVVAEGLNARGRWFVIGWPKDAKDMADKLRDRGCNMNPEPTTDSDAMAEVISRDIWERMRTGRFKVDKRLSEWVDEFKVFQRTENRVPRDDHPLMAATRHAIELLPYARAQTQHRNSGKLFPKVATI